MTGLDYEARTQHILIIRKAGKLKGEISMMGGEYQFIPASGTIWFTYAELVEITEKLQLMLTNINWYEGK